MLYVVNTNNYKLHKIYLPEKHRNIIRLFKRNNNLLLAYSDNGGLIFFDENFKINKIIQLKIVNNVSIAEYDNSIYVTQPFGAEKALAKINLQDLNINNSNLYRKIKYYKARVNFKHNQLINIKQHGLLFLTADGVLKYNHKNDVFENVNGLDGEITNIYDYEKNNLFVVKNNYLPLIYNYEKNKLMNIVYENKDNIEILKIIRKHDNIFIATNDGLIIINDKLKSYHLEKSNNNSPENKLIVRRAIIEKENEIYFFNYESIYKLNKSNLEYDVVNNEPLITYSAVNLKDDIYLGTEGRGLLKYNTKTNKVDELIPFEIFPDSSLISYIYAVNYNELLLGTNRGIYKYDIRENKLVSTIKYNKRHSNSIVKHINKIKNDYWVSTTDGLYIFNEKLINTKSIDKSNYPKLCSDSINFTYQLNDSIIYVGTYNGIQKFNISLNQFGEHYNEKNGLSNNIVTGIFKDNKNRIWVSTFNGLNLINNDKKQVKQFHKYNGLKNDEYNFNSYLYSSTGELFLGGINGYEKLKIDEIAFPHNKPKDIQISEIIIVNTINREQEIKLYEGGEINYNANNNLLRIKFSTNDYSNTNNLNYYAMLTGLSDAWIDLGNSPNARLFNIPRGNYTLVLKAVDKNNSENVFIKKVPLNVSQIFYKQIWFIPVISLSTILLTIFVFYTRRKVYETKEKLHQKLAVEKELQLALNKQKELNTMRSKFIALISHEYRTPLTAIQSSVDLMQLTINKEIENKKERQLNYLNNIKNQIIRLVEIINGVVTLNRSGDKFNDAIIHPVKIKPFIKESIKSFNIYDTQCVINFICETEDEIVCKIDEETFRNAFYNILNNAVKFYYKDTEIDVRLTVKDSMCLIIVRNLGIGIPSDEISKVFDVFYRCTNAENIPGLGTGLPIAKEFIKFNNGDIRIDSYINEYVNVEISLPLYNTSDISIED